MNNITEIFGTGRTLSPIAHHEILPMGYEKGNESKFRRESFLGEFEYEKKPILVPVISGNAVRGLCRRLLFDHTFSVLDVKIGDLFSSEKLAREIQNSLRVGGTTAKGTSVEAVSPQEYFNLLNNVPYIDTLGMVFQGHHFEGAAKVGMMMPYIKELQYCYQYTFSEEYQSKLRESLIDFETLNNSMKKTSYTKRKEIGALKSEDNEDLGKEAMLYGVEYLPAGTTLALDGKVISDNENTVLTFLAMYALLQEKGIIGGMSRIGYGFIRFELFQRTGAQVKEMDASEILEKYDTFLLENRNVILDQIKSIPTIFTATKVSKKKG